jgi:drug/metabolite transporter (DMT)-like permease
MKWSDFLELLVLGSIWGSSFLFMREATPEFGAIALVIIRTGIAAACLLPLLMLRGKLGMIKQHWRPLLFVGLVNTAIPFCLFSYSTVLLGAGLAAILNATAPMFGALVAFLWLKDRLSTSAVMGLFLGFAGVLVLTFSRSGITLSASVLPVLGALASTCAYGIAACYIKQRLSGVNSLAIATGSQVFATLALLPLAVFYWPQSMPSSTAWWQVIVLGVVCTGLAYIMYFRLIENIGAPKAITVGYLVPVFGVLWGMLFLQETLSPTMMVGGAMILTGVSLTTGIVRFRTRLA